MPLDFFIKHVIPTYRNWRIDASTHPEVHAKHLIGDINALVERLYHHFTATGNLEALGGTTTEKDFRKYLVSKCPVYQVLWDIADAYKHVTLKRSPRLVTKASQTRAKKIPYGIQAIGVRPFENEDVWVELDDGSEMLLDIIVEQNLAFVRQIISREWPDAELS